MPNVTLAKQNILQEVESATDVATAKKWIYAFAPGAAEGCADDRALLGGKGANLAQMCRYGLPVPPGFTVTTEAATAWADGGKTLPGDLEAAIFGALADLEVRAGRRFGCSRDPLLLSVRSGARVSMPGMMDTVLNLGMSEAAVEGLAAKTGDRRFAADTWRRFVQMYGTIVQDVDISLYEEVREAVMVGKGISDPTRLDADALMEIASRSLAAAEDDYDVVLPQDPREQLLLAVHAVFASWTSRRAIAYRAAHNIPSEWGTAINVQMMVFGNRGTRSGTGVAFTRDPSTGENRLYGEFLPNAQGEDIVSGLVTPHSITRAGKEHTRSETAAMEDLLPEAYAALDSVARDLETRFGDMQDIEFTVEDGKLWLLQTRDGKRSAGAAIRIAVEMADAGVISRRTALTRIDPSSLDQLLHPAIDPSATRTVIARGLPAAPGAVTGTIVFTSHDALDAAGTGEKVILVRPETSPEDIHGMHAAVGVLTSRGGMTSHAAVVARGMGKPCVTGAAHLRIDVGAGTMQAGDQTFRRGDTITIDGNSGQVMPGALPMVDPELSDDFRTLMTWADAERRMQVRTNADLPEDARVARSFGAEGIGLCRTEHMFLEYEDRLLAMRQMIMAADEAGRITALERILPMQRDDFVELFTTMAGLPVTIRLLDPPLSDFLPVDPAEQEELAGQLGIKREAIATRLEQLRDINPILGSRGVRIAITHPEIAAMQMRAVFEAAVIAGERTGNLVVPEIMVPLVAYNAELRHVRNHIDQIARSVMDETGSDFDYKVGCIIEVPRAAIRADVIAEAADFFSFGTNDLTQTTLGISRDDASTFLPRYAQEGIVTLDPFINLDVEGVGELIRIAAAKGLATRPDLQLSISGEHGGDPVSIAFCEEVGMHYVSCSPYRVPVAKLAAAQAKIARDGA